MISGAHGVTYLNAGGFGAVPAGMRHYGWTDGGQSCKFTVRDLLQSLTSTRLMILARA